MAGGASSRMGGRDKLLEEVDGTTLLWHQANNCLKSRAHSVRVVLPTDKAERSEALHGLDVEIVYNVSSALGMSHSLQCGIRGLDCDAVLIVLADLPDLRSADFDKVIDAAAMHPLANVLRGADHDGKPGHPVLLRKSLFNEVSELEGDTGAKPILKHHKADTILVPIGPAALRDLDTPDDWKQWRADQPK